MGNKVPYGYIERTHGLRGRMVLKLFVFGQAVPLDVGTVLYADGRVLTVTRSRKRDGKRLTIDCAEVAEKSQAEELVGSSVEVETSQVLKPGFPLPVYGFTEFTIVSRGERLPVVEVEYNSSNPQLLVEGAEGRFPVPLALALTGDVDSLNGTIGIDLPEGLEEL